MLDPAILAKIKTSSEIAAQIVIYEAKLERVSENFEYALDTSQSSQRVRQQDVDKIALLLNSWLTAKVIQDGNSPAKLYAGKYKGH